MTIKEQNTEHKTPNTNHGITLIALIITIIFMLILVAVTVTMAVNGGLFGKAQIAGTQTNEAVRKEQELGSGKIKIGDTEYDSPQEYVDTLTGKTTDTDNCETCGNFGRITVWECSNDDCGASSVESIRGYHVIFQCMEDDCGLVSSANLYAETYEDMEELAATITNVPKCPDCGSNPDLTYLDIDLCVACRLGEAWGLYYECPDCDNDFVLPDGA